jgi:tetratricopeptide (TPR) repeat protein
MATVGEERTAQNVLDSAIALHKGGRLEQAAALYESLLSEDNANASVLQLLGTLRHQMGDDSAAVELISRALALRPNMPAVHANLAEAYRTAGKLERALGCCRMALKLWPNCPELLCNLGLALHMQGRREEAVEQFRRALELRPDLAPAHNDLGVVLRELRRPEEALEHFRRAVEIDPSLAPAVANLGQALVDVGRPEDALQYCEHAVRLQPDAAVLHYGMGNALRGLQRWADSRAAYLEALRLDPELVQAYAHLGLTLLREGQPCEAQPWLKQAVECEPENAGFHQHLGDLYMGLQEPAGAIPHFERALALDGGSQVVLHLSLGQALVDEGRLAEAGEHYDAALQLNPRSAAVHVHLGGLHEVRGELARAEAAFRRAIRVQPGAPMPRAVLATLLRGDLPDSDLAALEERLADERLGEDLRARLLFGLAHVLDARGDYARAAGCSREANVLTLKGAKGVHAYDPCEHAALVDAVIATFSRAFLAASALSQVSLGVGRFSEIADTAWHKEVCHAKEVHRSSHG